MAKRRRKPARLKSRAEAKREAKKREAKKKGAPDAESIETTPLSSRSDRVVFWLLMITMIFTILSHVSLLFHAVKIIPRYYEAGIAKYGERVERFAHFYSLFAFAFALFMVVLKWLPRACSWRSHDIEWMRQMGGYGRKWARIPPAGRFNPEQKIATLAVLLFGALYVLSGVVQEQPALVGENVTLMRTAYSLHTFCLVALSFVALMHIYLGAFARPGGMGALWSGRVPKKFAEVHYSIWLEESLEAAKTEDGKDRRRHAKYVDMEKERIKKVMARRKKKMKAKAEGEDEAVKAELVMELAEDGIELELEVEEVETAEVQDIQEIELVEEVEAEEEAQEAQVEIVEEEEQEYEEYKENEHEEGEDEEGEDEGDIEDIQEIELDIQEKEFEEEDESAHPELEPDESEEEEREAEEE